MDAFVFHPLGHIMHRFVRFEKEEDAMTALNTMNNAELDGHILKVTLAHKKGVGGSPAPSTTVYLYHLPVFITEGTCNQLHSDTFVDILFIYICAFVGFIPRNADEARHQVRQGHSDRAAPVQQGPWPA